MGNANKIFCGFFSVFLFLLILSGCAPKKVHTDYTARASKIRSIGIIAPDIEFDDVHFGGVREKRDDWSDQANKNMIAALTGRLPARGFSVKVIPRDGEYRQTVEEIDGLFFSIVWCFRRYASAEGETQFPHKVDSFEYSIGSVSALLDAFHVDALIVLGGIGQERSLFTQGGSVVAMSFIDRTGDLLWLEYVIKRDQAFMSWDLRIRDQADSIITSMLEEMPEMKK